MVFFRVKMLKADKNLLKTSIEWSLCLQKHISCKDIL